MNLSDSGLTEIRALQKFPTELIVHILSFFSCSKDFRNFAVSCRRFAEILCDKTIQEKYKQRFLYDWPSYIYIIRFKKLAQERIFFTPRLFNVFVMTNDCSTVSVHELKDYAYEKCTIGNKQYPFKFGETWSMRKYPPLWYDLYEDKIYTKPPLSHCYANGIMMITWNALVNINLWQVVV